MLRSWMFTAALAVPGLASASMGTPVTPQNVLPPPHFMPAPAVPSAPAPVNSLPIPIGGYTLVSYTDGGRSVTPAPRRPTLQLDGQLVSGFAGCNRYMGRYAARENVLRFGKLSGTLMACSGPGSRIEQRYLKLLSRAEPFTVLGQQLVISAGQRDQLVFQQTAGVGEVPSSGSVLSLLNGEWVAQPSAALAPSSARLPSFTIKGSDIQGFDGCNSFWGKVNFSSGQLRLVGPVRFTRMACPPTVPTIAALLQRGGAYVLRGQQLILSASSETWLFVRR